ncbi:hypothetical protein [Chryseobacterium arthrosphaerae]|nr:hypothetical protein [Chryseobacterium arthrosphaerae]
MKKILQTLYSFKEIKVVDATTLSKEIAKYHMILGLNFLITYKTVK